MTTNALSQLREQIEAVRREAFADGYAAAMRLVKDFASRPPETAIPPGSAPRPRPPRPLSRRRSARPITGAAAGKAEPRPRRGTNARLVEAVLQSIAPRAVRPSEIRDVLRQEQGIALAFTSIRHALGQLKARSAVEQIAANKTWRYLSESSANDGIIG